MRKKNDLSTFQKWARASFKEMLRFKWQKIMTDKRVPVLWIVEIMLSVAIAVSIWLYLDPDVNVVPFPWNYVAFVILVGIALLIHRRTRPFRVARRLKQKRK